MNGKGFESNSNSRAFMLHTLALALVVTVLFVSSCGLVVSDPIRPVKRFWEALAKDDQNTMLDCLHPDLRAGVDPFGCILPGGEWTLILSKRLGLELTNVEYRVLEQSEDEAVVLATGRIPVPEGIPLLGGTVRQFEVRHRVVREGRDWFIVCP